MPPLKRSLSKAIRNGGHFYFDNPSVDQVLAMLLTLSGEVWALRERLAALESLAQRRNILTPGEVEQLNFSEAEETQLAAQRREFLASLFGILAIPRVQGTAGTARGGEGSSAGATAKPRMKKSSDRRPRSRARGK